MKDERGFGCPAGGWAGRGGFMDEMDGMGEMDYGRYGRAG